MIAQIKMRRGTTAEWAAASPVVLAAGEPGWDSTLKGMKVGDGSTEWAALPWIDAKNRPDINADTLDGVHLSDIRLGQNILHNWDFRNPINQRGVSGAISTGTYFYDRWIRNTGTVTTNAAYLTIGADAFITQRIDGLFLSGRTVTVSLLLSSGGILQGSGTFASTAGTFYTIAISGFGNINLGVGDAGTYNYISLYPNTIVNIAAIKLELGTVGTLHLDPPMDYGIELAKCQRYFKNDFRQMGKGAYVTSGQIMMVLTFENGFRIIPTLAIPSYEKLLVCPVVAEYTPSSHDVVVLSKHFTVITFLGTFTGANYGVTYAATTAASLMSLSADL